MLSLKPQGPVGNNFLGLDYGSKRLGLALGSDEAKIAEPFQTIPNDDQLMTTLAAICTAQAINEIVLGWPRGLEGQTTKQSELVAIFGKHLKERLGLPVHLQDEAVTSEVVENRLRTAGQKYDKTRVDQEAAAIILQDFLDNL